MSAPTYKSVYFRDFPASESRRKALTIAVGAGEPELASAVRGMSSHQLRAAIGFSSYSDLSHAAAVADLPVHTFCIRALKAWHRKSAEAGPRLPGLGGPISHLITFSDDRGAPFQRWYPLLEGYSLAFVELLLTERVRRPTRVLDPFGGVGTTPLAAALRGSSAFYAELNPVFQKVANAKFRALGLRDADRATVVSELRTLADLLPAAVNVAGKDQELRCAYSRTFGGSRFFDEDTLETVLSIRRAIDVLDTRLELTRDLFEVAAIASLQPASFLIRAGDLRYRRGRELDRMETLMCGLRDRVLSIADDVERSEAVAEQPLLVAADAQRLHCLPPLEIDAVVTSPPYLNGTNYIRNTKLELWFIRALRAKSDLRSYRDTSITAGINDVRGIDPPVCFEAARRVIARLQNNAYDSRIPRMVSSYVDGMDKVFSGLAVHMRAGAPVLVDIGDSSYAGVHVPTDELVAEVAAHSGFRSADSELLRTRVSRTGIALSQKLLTFYCEPRKRGGLSRSPRYRIPGFSRWEEFKSDLPHQINPYAKRNWGNARHSICSYPGKLKPAIARHLIDVFVPDGGLLLDPFAGVGTLPFEACLTGRRGIGFEISPAALAIMTAKLVPAPAADIAEVIEDLGEHINSSDVSEVDRRSAEGIRFNGRLQSYFHNDTFNEILLARAFFRELEDSPAKAFVLACMLHVLHGNRPYALSRRSHPITPFAPSGRSEYKSVASHVLAKVNRMLRTSLPRSYLRGDAILQDSTEPWPVKVANVDAVITSPPFFDSTRFYMANWMRLWFCGWDREQFDSEPQRYVDVRQKRSFAIYEPVFRQARERLKSGGVMVLHVGKSHKSDMADALSKVAAPWFRVVDRFDESVRHTESHGMRDKGTVTSHQYLVLM